MHLVVTWFQADMPLQIDIFTPVLAVASEISPNYLIFFMINSSARGLSGIPEYKRRAPKEERG